jgi:hypothetical protein
VIDHIDRADQLDLQQQNALNAARSLFDWRDRGRTLLAEIEHLRLERLARLAP